MKKRKKIADLKKNKMELQKNNLVEKLDGRVTQI